MFIFSWGNNMLVRKTIVIFMMLAMVITPLISFFSTVSSADHVETQGSSKEWTIMLYDDVDFYHAFDPLWIIVNNTGSTENVNVLVLQDKEHGPARIWYIDEDYNKVLLEELGEVNMGNYTTLRDFVDYCKINYPAERYMITLYNHGGAWRGACWDYTNNSDNLEMDEIQTALNESGGVDIISFSACEMGCIEGAYELRDVVDVYVGSEEMWGFGETWLKITRILDENAEDSTYNISKKIIEMYKDYFPYFSRSVKFIDLYNSNKRLIRSLLIFLLRTMPITLSAVRTDKIETLVSSVDNLSNVLIENINLYRITITGVRFKVEDFPMPMSIVSPLGRFVDIYHFVELMDKPRFRLLTPELHEVVEDVKENLEQTLIDEHHQIGHRNAHGLSIYFPPKYTIPEFKRYDSLYSNCGLDFTEDTSWDEFLELYLGIYRILS